MALYTTSIEEALSRTASIEQYIETAEPVWTKLNPTTDRGRFFVKDTIAEAEMAVSPPLVGGLSSKSVKDCRLSAGAAVRPRTVKAVGITGGYVEGAQGGQEVQPGAHKATVKARRGLKSCKRQAKRTVKREAVIRELQARGYNVKG